MDMEPNGFAKLSIFPSNLTFPDFFFKNLKGGKKISSSRLASTDLPFWREKKSTILNQMSAPGPVLLPAIIEL